MEIIFWKGSEEGECFSVDFHEELRRIMALLDDPGVSDAEKRKLDADLEKLLYDYQEKRRREREGKAARDG